MKPIVREKRYSVIYGAKLKAKDGQHVKEGQILAEWDPYTMPILSEESGKIKYGDIFEGETMQESKDEVNRSFVQSYYRSRKNSDLRTTNIH